MSCGNFKLNYIYREPPPQNKVTFTGTRSYNMEISLVWSRRKSIHYFTVYEFIYLLILSFLPLEYQVHDNQDFICFNYICDLTNF